MSRASPGWPCVASCWASSSKSALPPLEGGGAPERPLDSTHSTRPLSAKAEYHRAGFFPAATYLASAYYLPRELSVRVGAFYCTGAISGAFSGLLAAAITQMDGVGGYEGWRWIFILEGLGTVVIGVITVFFLIDLPSSSTRWLGRDELRFLEVQRKLKQGGLGADGSDVEGGELGFQWYQLRMVLTNWKNCLLGLCLACQAVGFYGGPLRVLPG